MTHNEQKSYSFEELKMGMTASISTVTSEQDVQTFARISGDHNPVHLNADYAATTIFKERIAHGILTAAYISAVIGTKLPGPGCIYVSQDLKFRAPVHLGDTVETTVTVDELNVERKRVILACNCSVDGKTVLEGNAVIIIPSRS